MHFSATLCSIRRPTDPNISGILGVREHADPHHHRHRPLRRHRLPLQGQDAGMYGGKKGAEISIMKRLSYPTDIICTLSPG